MKLIIGETKTEYHLVEVDDEIDMNVIIEQIKSGLSSYEHGWEALRDILDLYKLNFGVNYELKPIECGTEIDDIYIENIIDE
nr:MAG TPA: hypothetical protein [Caudoviricetes sp.]